MPILELMAHGLNNLFLRALGAERQHRDRNLQVVAHAFLSHDREVELLARPVIHDAVDFIVRRLQAQRVVLGRDFLARFVEGALDRIFLVERTAQLPRLLHRLHHAEEEVDFLLFARRERHFVLHHAAEHE